MLNYSRGCVKIQTSCVACLCRCVDMQAQSGRPAMCRQVRMVVDLIRGLMCHMACMARKADASSCKAWMMTCRCCRFLTETITSVVLSPAAAIVATNPPTSLTSPHSNESDPDHSHQATILSITSTAIWSSPRPSARVHASQSSTRGCRYPIQYPLKAKLMTPCASMVLTSTEIYGHSPNLCQP